MAGYSNPEKAELTFMLNSFGTPQELSGKKAWATQILQLMFYEPGTFQSDDEIGCGITKETFRDAEYIENVISPKIDAMVDKYLPDIPFSGIKVSIPEDLTDTVIYYILFSDTDTGGYSFVTVAVAEKNDIIDYSILI